MSRNPPEPRATFTRAIERAAKQIPLEETALDTLLLPFWSEAVHELLLGTCSCTQERVVHICFLQLSADQQIALFSDSALAYSEFTSIFREGRQKLLDTLGASPDA